jgi:hypothetical protein
MRGRFLGDLIMVVALPVIGLIVATILAFLITQVPRL